MSQHAIARRTAITTALHAALLVGLCGQLSPRHVAAAPPTPDHVVIVIEENHSFSGVIGSPSAPYMNSLATSGALLTNMYALTHPSQPNYLQFFSGGNQGVTNNTVPAPGSPFSTPNLGAGLISAGASFVGYSEDLPAAGSTVGSNGDYMRKHNPWVNWQANSPGPNQLSPSVNQPFSAFPVDFNNLPKVSIVVPNQQNDMHDGTIAQADAWLVNNIKPYADWAQTHNSLLIVTWDEDNSAERNHIPTILSGPMVAPGVNNSTWTLHNLTRTIEDMYGAGHAGSMAQVQPIIGSFTTDPSVITQTFRQGVAGYGSAQDTYIEQANAALAHGGDLQVVVDGSPLSQGLIRFDDLFGPGPGQVPVGATIASAKLTLLTGGVSSDATVDKMSLFAMIADWADSSTWNSLGGGVSTDGIEAALGAEFTLLPDQANNYAIFDVTQSVLTWAQDPSQNHGWLIQPSGGDGWRFTSSNASTLGNRPVLEIVYVLPEPSSIALLLGGGLALSALARSRRAAAGRAART